MAAVVSDDGSCTDKCFSPVRSIETTNAHKQVPAFDIQSQMNTFGFNYKKKNTDVTCLTISTTRVLFHLQAFSGAAYITVLKNLFYRLYHYFDV